MIKFTVRQTGNTELDRVQYEIRSAFASLQLAAQPTLTTNIGQLTITGGSINLTPTGVVPGAYTNTNLTVDTWGRITKAANGSAAPISAPYWLSSNTPALPSSVNMGALASGVLQQTVTSSVATPTALAMVPGQVPFGAPSNGLLTQSPNITWASSTVGLKLVTSSPGFGNDSILSLVSTAAARSGIRVQLIADGGLVGQLFGINEENTSAGYGMSLSSGPSAHPQNDTITVNAATGIFPFITWVYDYDVAIGAQSVMAPASTTGFVWLPSVSGTPTGTPTHPAPIGLTSDRVPIVIDTTHSPPREYTRVGGTWYYTEFNNGGVTGINQLTGDVTAGPGTGSQVATLKNTGPGTTSATYASVSIDPQGRVTALSSGATPQPQLSLTNTDVLFASGAHTVGQDNNFTYASGALSVATVQGPSTSLTLQNNASNNTFLQLTSSQITLGGGSLVPDTTTVRNLGSTTNLWQTLFIENVFGNGGNNLLLQDKATSANTKILLGSTSISTTGDILPSLDQTFNLGNSTHIWANQHLDTLNVGSTVQGFGNPYLNLQDSSSVNTYIQLGASQIDIQGNFVPSVNDSYSLGSGSKAWATLWVTSIAKGAAGTTLNFATGGAAIETTSTDVFSIQHVAAKRFTSDATGISFFGGTTVGQQTGGAATAGVIYTATEQGMINRMYTALRAYALIT